MLNTPYKEAVRNAAAHLLNHPTGTDGCIDAFTLSTTLAISFGFDKVRVIEDVLNERKNLAELPNSDPDFDGTY